MLSIESSSDELLSSDCITAPFQKKKMSLVCGDVKRTSWTWVPLASFTSRLIGLGMMKKRLQTNTSVECRSQKATTANS